MSTPRPFRAILIAQARYLAPIVALGTIVAASIPLLTLQGTGGQVFGRLNMLLSSSYEHGAWYPALAVAMGLLYAGANWLPDATGRWVYAFTLPVSRERLALMRLGAGGILMLPAVAAIWIVGTIGAATAALPPMVQSHAGALALRFGAATLVVYLAGSVLVLIGRKAWYLVVGIMVVLLVTNYSLTLYGSVMDTLFLGPWSPLHVLAGYWLYLDV